MIRVGFSRRWTFSFPTRNRGIRWIPRCLNMNSIPRHGIIPSKSDPAASLKKFHCLKRPCCVNNYCTVMQPELLSLPACLDRSTAFVVFALAIFLVAAHTGIAAIAAQRTALPPKTKTIVSFVVAGFLASWLAIAILIGDGANFPIRLESRQGISGLVALIPV